MNFSELITALSKVNMGLQEQSIRAVNLSLTMRNWCFGFYIVEFEQNGSDRAGYGKVLLATISNERVCWFETTGSPSGKGSGTGSFGSLSTISVGDLMQSFA